MVELILPAKAGDDLNWERALLEAKRVVACGEEVLWMLDLGLEAADFKLEDEMSFRAASLALKQFTAQCLFSGVKGVSFYRGKIELSRVDSLERWLRMAAAELPEDLPIFLFFDVSFYSRMEALLLTSPERFEHFEITLSPDYRTRGKAPSLGVCLPEAQACSSAVLEQLEQLLQKLDLGERSYRIVYEPFLTEQWDGLDEIIVLETALSLRGERMLKGFRAAGGVVLKFGVEGFEPPAYWSQTSRASQTALYPDRRLEIL